MNIMENVKYVGFYTTRFVDAGAPEAAEDAAVALIRADPKLKDSVLNDRNNPPMIFVESIEQVSESDVPEILQGYSFFVQEE